MATIVGCRHFDHDINNHSRIEVQGWRIYPILPPKPSHSFGALDNSRGMKIRKTPPAVSKVRKV